jgi:hypothetical protein
MGREQQGWFLRAVNIRDVEVLNDPLVIGVEISEPTVDPDRICHVADLFFFLPHFAEQFVEPVDNGGCPGVRRHDGFQLIVGFLIRAADQGLFDDMPSSFTIVRNGWILASRKVICLGRRGIFVRSPQGESGVIPRE